MKVRAWNVEIYVRDEKDGPMVHDQEYSVSGNDIKVAIDNAILAAKKDNKVSVEFEAQSAVLVAEVEVDEQKRSE